MSTTSTSVNTTDILHRLQDIWRDTELGLAIAYRDNDNVRISVRRAAVLPLVPLELVEDVRFNALADPDIDRMHAMTQVKEIQKHRQQANNTHTPILASRTYRPSHISSPHGHSTVVQLTFISISIVILTYL